LSAAQHLLDELVDIHLLREPTPGRYRFHDLVRQYAHTKSEPNRDAITRLFAHYVYLARLTDIYLNPLPQQAPTELEPPGPVPDITDLQTAIQWCEAELRNLMATIDYAATNGWPDYPWALASQLTWFFDRRGHAADCITSLQVAARLVTDDNDRAGVLLELGRAYHCRCDGGGGTATELTCVGSRRRFSGTLRMPVGAAQPQTEAFLFSVVW
jgi:hypothetical protein